MRIGDRHRELGGAVPVEQEEGVAAARAREFVGLGVCAPAERADGLPPRRAALGSEDALRTAHGSGEHRTQHEVLEELLLDMARLIRVVKGRVYDTSFAEPCLPKQTTLTVVAIRNRTLDQRPAHTLIEDLRRPPPAEVEVNHSSPEELGKSRVKHAGVGRP